MSLLTDREIKDIEMYARSVTEWNLQFARAIEAAVIKKLATVSVEPVACYAGHRITPDGTTEFYGYADKKLEPSTMLYPAEALAAARVQALEDAAKRMEGPNNNYGAVIRALIGAKE